MMDRAEALIRRLREDGRWLALLLLGMFAAVVWFLVVAPYLERYRAVEYQIESLVRMRTALVGLVQQTPDLEAALLSASPDVSLLLPVAERNLASAELQSRIDQLLPRHPGQHCTLRSHRNVDSRRGRDENTVALRLEIDCAWELLVGFLHTIESARPLILIEGLLLSTRTRSGVGPGPTAEVPLLRAQVELMAYLDPRTMP